MTSAHKVDGDQRDVDGARDREHADDLRQLEVRAQHDRHRAGEDKRGRVAQTQGWIIGPRRREHADHKQRDERLHPSNRAKIMLRIEQKPNDQKAVHDRFDRKDRIVSPRPDNVQIRIRHVRREHGENDAHHAQEEQDDHRFVNFIRHVSS
jgi:hypothetical protein